MTRKRKRRRTRNDTLALAVSRGLLQAFDAQAYEKAYDTILKDPDVQKAIDELIDKMVLFVRKRRAKRRASA